MKKIELPKVRKLSIKEIWYQVKAEFRKDTSDPFRLAIAVGMGLAFGVSPVWGFQMLSAYATATFFKANRVIVLAATYISNPASIPIIIYYSFVIGGWFVPPAQRATISDVAKVDSIGQNLYQYLLGSLLMSVALGTIGTLLSYLIICAW